MNNSQIGLTDRPSINPVYVFRWEESQQSHMLLYPEGLIKLNGPAGYIMNLVDGERTLEDIVQELKQQFDAGDELADDVHAFMETALDKGWIRV